MSKKSVAIIVFAVIALFLAFIAGIKLFYNPTPLEPKKSDETFSEQHKNDIEYTVSLYFSSEDAMNLLLEKRTVKVKSEEELPIEIINQIIAGPDEDDKFPTLDKTSEVKSVTVKDKIATVEVGENFVAKNTGGSTKEFLAVYSIVNSLIELDNIDSVQFSQDGQILKEFGSFYFDEPCTKDNSLLN